MKKNLIIITLTTIISAPIGYLLTIFKVLDKNACGRFLVIKCPVGTEFKEGFPLAFRSLKIVEEKSSDPKLGKYLTTSIISENQLNKFLNVLFWTLIVFFGFLPSL